MAEKRVQRRLAAILAADVVGYSRLMREDETGTLAQLKTLRKEVFDPRVADHNGRIVKTTGDGVLVEFASAVDATECAVKIQRALARRNEDVPEGQRIELRIGINLGDIIVDGEDIYGDGVNVAARLEGLCDTGEVYVSAVVHDQVEGKIDVAFEDLGEHIVKNITAPVHVYRVQAALPEAIRPPPLGPSAIAVLPFENLSGDPDQEYFADGLTEDIITALSLCRSFPVISRNSVFAYKGQSPDIRKVGAELGARYVIEGSVRRSGERIRVTAQLINAENGHHLWAERYDRRIAEIFDLQDELTERLAATIAPELERAEQKRARSQRPNNLDAWEHVQRGMALLAERTLEGNARGREAFDRAIDQDPEYSRAFAGLSWSYHRDLTIGNLERREETLARALDTARRAISLDPGDSMAHDALGIALNWAKEFGEAIAAFEHSIALNPSNFQAYVSIGHSLTLAGRPDEGVTALEKGLELNPHDPRNHLYFAFLARAHLTARRYGDAIEWARTSIRRRPDILEPHVILATALGHLDRLPEARTALGECERIDPISMASLATWQRYERETDNEHFLEGLRKAGWEG